MKNWVQAFVVMACSIAVLTGCGKVDSTVVQKTSITDSSGKQVEIPAQIQRIGDSWGAHNEVLMMLGAGDKIAATVFTKESRPWMYKVNPQLNQASIAFTMTTDIDTEALVKAKPDVVFTPVNEKNAKKLADLSIPVVQLSFTDFDSMKQCFQTTGKILGKEGEKRAADFIAYFDGKLKAITDVTSQIPREQRPKVLHIISLSPLIVDGTDTIINSWIEAAGGVNAAQISGNAKTVSMEQILQWNPDVVIVSGIVSNTAVTLTAGQNSESVKQILSNPVWQQVRAVRGGKVYGNPDGVFLWDRYGPEVALQIQWAAKILYPEKFTGLDINVETQYFYKTFLNYNLSENETERIINAQPPVF